MNRAEALLEDSITKIKQVIPNNSEDLRSMVLVAREYSGIGDLFMKRALPDDAISAYSAALEQLDPVAENGLGSDGWRHLLAEIHLKASFAYEGAGRNLESKSSAETAREMLLELTADHPDINSWKGELDRAGAQIDRIHLRPTD